MSKIEFSPESEEAFRLMMLGGAPQVQKPQLIHESASWPERGYSPPFDPAKIRGGNGHELNAEHRRTHLLTKLWERSERFLSVLRTKGASNADEGKVQEALFSFAKGIEIDAFSESRLKAAPLNPNHYYQFNFGELVLRYGFAFDRIISKRAPVETCCIAFNEGSDAPVEEHLTGINTDFFAALLGGDKRLGHDVIYYVPEGIFFFLDLATGCYMPTTEDKLEILLSLILRERAAGQEVEVAAFILEKFRTKQVFKDIIGKAKALLAADVGFFTGLNAKPKWGAYEDRLLSETHKDLVIRFVKELMEPTEGATLTLQDCLNRFKKFSANYNIAKGVLKKDIEDAVLTIHGRGIRHDLRQRDGRCVAAWKGLTLRVCDYSPGEINPSEGFYPSSVGSARSDLSVSSGMDARTITEMAASDELTLAT